MSRPEPFVAAVAPPFTVVTLVNDASMYSVMRSTLEDQYSPDLVSFISVEADKRGWNAATALNHGLDSATTDWVVCAHQDVLFPKGWWERAWRQISAWPGPIGVVGLVGTTHSGRFVGHVLDPKGRCCWSEDPQKVFGMDEHVLVVRKSSGLRFDAETPAFHCYGTDIALQATVSGLDAVVINAPVVHLSSGRLDDKFWRSAKWLLSKWGKHVGGVLPTCAVLIRSNSMRSIPRTLFVKIMRRFGKRHHTQTDLLRDSAWRSA